MKELRVEFVYDLIYPKVQEFIENKLFGKNKYISPVIFNGNESIIGKIVKVKVQNSNQNTLFGVLDKKKKAA